MPEKTTHARIKQSTLTRLKEEAKSIVKSVEEGRREDPGINPEPINPMCIGLTIDQIINMLLDLREDHKRRSKKSAAKKSKVKQTEGE